jgi:hypothetical protein
MNYNFERLEQLSHRLNASSDSLTEAIQQVQKKLASLRLGVRAFAPTPIETIRGTCGDQEVTTHRVLSYDEGDNGWRLIVAELDDQGKFLGETPLLQASRDIRIKAMHRLPELIEQLESHAKNLLEDVEAAINLTKPI